MTHALLPVFTARDSRWAIVENGRVAFGYALHTFHTLSAYPSSPPLASSSLGLVSISATVAMGRNRAVHVRRQLCARLHKYKHGMPMILECGAIACWRFGPGGGREGQCQPWRKPVPTSLRWDKSPSTPRKKSANPCIRPRARRNLSYQLSLSLLLLLRATTSLAQNHFNLGVKPPSHQASNLTLFSLIFSRKFSFRDSLGVAKKSRCARRACTFRLFTIRFCACWPEKVPPHVFLMLYHTHLLTTLYSHKPIIKPR